MPMKYGLEDIKRLLQNSKYYKTENDWFFPSDLISHSNALKYTCNKLFEQGILERQGCVGDRWGYFYRIRT